METVEKFMQSFFEQRTLLVRATEEGRRPFFERCYTAEYLASRRKEYDKYVLKKIIPSVVLRIEIQGETATVITLEPFPWGTELEKCLYKLRLINMGWQIDEKARVCIRCAGSGVFCGDICSSCEGSKWRFYLGSKRK